MPKRVVVRPPVDIVSGWKNIAEAFKTGAKTVKRWEKEKAPIFRDERGRPKADMWELWEWVKGR